ncbi:MAG: type II toxin-antitoxin system RelE/ParE family toxin [Candidatus Manganitrophaceae bacterium]
MKLEPIYKGPAFALYGIVQSTECLVQEFIDTLPQAEQKKIIALLKRTADHGLPKNEEKFKKLWDDLFEFKTGQVRIICFFDKGRLIILTHGFLKKSQKTPRTEVEKARRLMNMYLQERGE